MLQTNAVEKSTLELLKRLQGMPFFSNLRLVGGTALALQLGHRFSVDLDFFGSMDTTASAIAEELRARMFHPIDWETVKSFLRREIQQF